MPGDIEIQLSGFKELAKQLRELPEKIARTEMDKALREAAQPMLKAARRNAPVLPYSTTQRRAGTVRRNIRLKIFRVRGSLNRGISIGVRRLSTQQVRVNKRVARVSKRRLGVNISAYFNDPFYWYFLEKGTVKMFARRFLENAFTANRDQFLERFKLILGGRIATIWNQKG